MPVRSYKLREERNVRYKMYAKSINVLLSTEISI